MSAAIQPSDIAGSVTAQQVFSPVAEAGPSLTEPLPKDKSNYALQLPPKQSGPSSTEVDRPAPVFSPVAEAGPSLTEPLPKDKSNYALQLPSLPELANLPSPGIVQRPGQKPTPEPSEKNDVPQGAESFAKPKPYFDIKRLPGNGQIEIFPGSIQLVQTYVTNIGTAAWSGSITDDLTNSYYIKVINPQASSGKLTRGSRTGSLNGKTVNFLKWEGTLIPGQTLLISYEITVAPDTPRGIIFKSLFYNGMQNVSGSCTWGYYTVCQRIFKVQLPPNIQVRRSPGNTTIIPGITETHYIYFTNSSAMSWSGFIDEEFTGYENMNIGRIRTTHGNVTRPHESYMRWSGTIGPKQTVTFSYQTTAKEDTVHGSVFKARFYTGLNGVKNNCIRDISQCERTTTILIPPRFEVSRAVTSSVINNGTNTTYTITIKNTGGVGASTRGLVETMADKMIYEGVSPGTPVPTHDGRKILWASVYLMAGAQIVYRYTAYPSGALADEELTSTAVVGDVRGNCTLGSGNTACRSTVHIQDPVSIQVRRSPGNTTIVPRITETHYIYVTNSGGISWSGFIDEEFTGYQNVIVGRTRATHGNVTRPHESYMRWSGTIAPGETVTISYQSTAKSTAPHGSVFKARFYTGLNDVDNNCIGDISQCERSTTIVVPRKS